MDDELTFDEVISMLEQAVTQAGGARAYAKLHAVSPTFVNQVLLCQRPPTGPILKALGLERRVTHTYHRHAPAGRRQPSGAEAGPGGRIRPEKLSTALRGS